MGRTEGERARTMRGGRGRGWKARRGRTQNQSKIGRKRDSRMSFSLLPYFPPQSISLSICAPSHAYSPHEAARAASSRPLRDDEFGR
jgi:hypothetical protein